MPRECILYLRLAGGCALKIEGDPEVREFADLLHAIEFIQSRGEEAIATGYDVTGKVAFSWSLNTSPPRHDRRSAPLIISG